MGVYPAGSLVELSSAEVGIVVKENPGKRLRPHVLVVLDSNKKHLVEFTELDLATFKSPDNKSIDIARTLETGAYGLDPEKLYI